MVHNFDPKILPEGSAKLRRVGQGASYFIASVVQLKEKKPLTWEAQVLIDFIYFWRLNKKQRSYDGRGGVRSAPFGVAVSSKRRVRAAHGRARAAKTH
jgi:hypothetical protein